MVAISPTHTTALMLLQKSQLTGFRNAAARLPTEHVAVIGGDAVGAQVRDVFAGNADFQKQFADEYDRALQENPGISSANAAHIATVGVVTKNRGSFPPGGFAIHTDLPGGGSITSLIQPVSGPRISFAVADAVAAKTASARAARSQIAETLAAQDTVTALPAGVQSLRDRVAAHYHAS